ncbi:hypothetical protein DF3PA_350009 [Candidatus Defluviicoccus seviourii]|uniref:Uncharacterized protein n=2 Tax=root TaxID=1 RepID=A0A564WF02_9PROT|nr:hypothetical protein DF3PB_80027 [uncultured Defluviicoccus sp.]VUX47077.1 hypothetical protein DF3PA_350009 [Candidatus Defluviicoccus seviourii]
MHAAPEGWRARCDYQASSFAVSVPSDAASKRMQRTYSKLTPIHGCTQADTGALRWLILLHSLVRWRPRKCYFRPSHGGNRGSNPLGDASKSKALAFLYPPRTEKIRKICHEPAGFPPGCRAAGRDGVGAGGDGEPLAWR